MKISTKKDIWSAQRIHIKKKIPVNKKKLETQTENVKHNPDADGIVLLLQ